MTVAVNCNCAPGATCAELGETETDTTAMANADEPITKARQAKIVSRFISHRQFHAWFTSRELIFFVIPAAAER